jgi:hypothetical protein
MFAGQQAEDPQKMIDMVRRVHAGISGMRDEWVRHRAASGVEERWRTSKILYDGSQAQAERAFVDALKNGPMKRTAQAQRSKLVVNIVQPKVDQAISRMCEILLPTDGKNWGVEPTPVPDHISKMVGDERPTVIPGTDTQTGLTADMEAKAYMAAVKESNEGMERAIDDALTETRYNGESRKVIENGVKLGSGIMLGPMPAKQVASKWTQQAGVFKKLTTSKVIPGSESWDPWDIWFDPSCGNDHQRGRGFWILKRATRKELRALADAPGFSRDLVSHILKQPPTRISVVEGRVQRTHTAASETYEIWTYYGEVEPEQMMLVSMGGNGDPLVDVERGVVVVCQDMVIGAMPSWLDDETLPVDVWCWRKDDATPYGHSLCNSLEHQQSAVIAAWRQVMDNARVTAGGQIVIGEGIEAADGSNEITPNKLWHADSSVQDVTKAFAVFNFASHIDELLKIASTAMQLADQETSMPQLIAGEQDRDAPETLGGMIMRFSSASAVLRWRCKLYDDNLTKPHITRHFDWQMQYNPDDSIKGDMEIVAIGATALLERDIQNQGALNMVAVTSNERYARFVDPKKELTIVLKAMKQRPEDIMFDDAQIAENDAAAQAQPAPEDPQLARANAVLEAKKLDIADRQEQRAADQQRLAEESALKRETLAYNQTREQEESRLTMADLQLTREIEINKMDRDAMESAAERASKERMQAIDLSNDRELFNAEAQLKIQQGSGI